MRRAPSLERRGAVQAQRSRPSRSSRVRPRGGARFGQRGVGERALLRLELEDALLDRARRDQPVDEHGLVLADAVGAVGGLVLDRRVPPGIEQEDVVGRGEVEAGAAGLERDQASPAARPRPGSARPRRRDRAWSRRGARSGCPAASRRGSTRSSSEVHCEKTSALWPSAAHLSSALDEQLELGGARRASGPGAGAGGSGLAQAEQRLERADARRRPSRAARATSARVAARDRVVERRARARRASTCSTTSVRGGSSGATSLLSRRSTNGRMRCAQALGRARVALRDRAARSARRSRCARRAGRGSRSGTGSRARRAGSRPACR